jgi:hypothetical protein
MKYFFQVLSPAPTETLDLMGANGQYRKETVQTTIRLGKPILDLTTSDSDYWSLVRSDEEEDHLNRERYYESGDAFIWRMPSFEVDPNDVDSVFAKAMKHKTLIIDLRGNSGGYIDTLKEMLGRLFDHDIKIGDRVSRKETKPEIAKKHGPTYTGNVIVLVDSGSASASELFARVIQLEKRGKVIGDTTSGAVMEAHAVTQTVGGDYIIVYGLSVTVANILMTDGKSLEKVGVVPDEIIIPTVQDIGSGKDPVLAHAADLAGMQLDPTAAGKLFPFEWPPL